MKKASTQDEDTKLRSNLAAGVMAREIRAAIVSGELKEGDLLPSDSQLKDKYGISISSVRRSMKSLADGGIVTRKWGSGSYVRAIQIPSKRVVADTILQVKGVYHIPNHPFFGERERALTSRLKELGWISELRGANDETHDPSSEHITAWWSAIDPELIGRLRINAQIAGLVLDSATVEPVTKALGGRIPCVCLNETKHCPFVDYRWDEELALAVGLAADAGAERIWLFGNKNEEALMGERIQRLAAAYAGRPLTLRPYCTPCHPSHSVRIGQINNEAYLAAKQALKDGLSGRDGVVMCSDVHAEGVLDALGELPLSARENLQLVAMINKESRIHSAIPFTALVADGAVAGASAANLLDKLIREPNHAPRAVYLRSAVHLCANH